MSSGIGPQSDVKRGLDESRRRLLEAQAAQDIRSELVDKIHRRMAKRLEELAVCWPPADGSNLMLVIAEELADIRTCTGTS